jgi:hypothetical protein
MNRGFDFIGDVRNHLNGFTEIIAAPFLLDNGFVNAACSEVVFARQLGVRVTLVMAKVQVGLGAIVGYIDFAMLVRTHGSRIDIRKDRISAD